MVSPPHFVRSGDIGIFGGILWGAGYAGIYWSSIANSDPANAYGLIFDNNSIHSSGSSPQGTAFPLRCLAS